MPRMSWTDRRRGPATSTPVNRELRIRSRPECSQQPLQPQPSNFTDDIIYVGTCKSGQSLRPLAPEVQVLENKNFPGVQGGPGEASNFRFTTGPITRSHYHDDDVKVIEILAPRSASGTPKSPIKEPSPKPQPMTNKDDFLSTLERSSWMKTKVAPPKRFFVPPSENVQKAVFGPKDKVSKSKTKMVKSPGGLQKLSRTSRSALNGSYQLEEKKRYSDLLKSFLGASSMMLPIKRSSKMSLVPILRKSNIRQPMLAIQDRVDIIDLTLDEDNQLELFHTSPQERQVLPSSPYLRSTSTSKQLLALPENEEITEKDDAIPMTVMAEVINVPKSPPVNTLALELAKKPALQPHHAARLLTDYNDTKLLAEEQIRAAKLRIKLCSQKAKEEMHDKLVYKIQKQLQLFDIEKETEIEEVEEEVDEFPELSPEADAIVAAAWRRNATNDKLISGFNTELHRRDLLTLSNQEWLNDEVINFYMNLIIERGKNDNYPSVHSFNTFFYPKLCKMGYSSVRRWTKSVDIFAHELVLVPIHLAIHWCMAIIDLKNKNITYYDSMGGPDNGCLQTLMRYLESESMDKKKQPFDSSGWELITAKDIPHQMNGSDCGMFSCMFAESVSRRRPFAFTQQHMPYLRRRVAYELLNKQLVM